MFWNKRPERYDATSLLYDRSLPTTADKHLALQLSSNRSVYVYLDQVQ